MLPAGFRLLLWLIVPAMAGAQSMEEAASQLASRISSLLPPRATVSFDFQSLTPLAPTESSAFRNTLARELNKLGIGTTAATQHESRLRVTISGNPRGLLFVAEVTFGERRHVVMLPWTAPRV